MRHLRFLDTGPACAVENMRQDRALLDSVEPCGQAVVHFYEWEGDAATYGYFTDPARFLDVSAASRLSLALARRPTGGGILFHLTDFAFSVVVPREHAWFSLNTMENYRRVNRVVIDALDGCGLASSQMELLPSHLAGEGGDRDRFCMAKPTKYDVLWRGQKIGGAAQRQTRAAYLHQGTISVAPLPSAYLESLLIDGGVIAAMRRHSAFLLPEGWTASSLAAARKELKSALQLAFARAIG